MKTIKSNCSDFELSALIAEHVCDWHVSEARGQWGSDGRDLPPFATSADAVLPLLEKVFAVWSYHTDRPPGHFCADVHPRGFAFIEANGPFARAACFALLKVKGWTVEVSA